MLTTLTASSPMMRLDRTLGFRQQFSIDLDGSIVTSGQRGTCRLGGRLSLRGRDRRQSFGSSYGREWFSSRGKAHPRMRTLLRFLVAVCVAVIVVCAAQFVLAAVVQAESVADSGGTTYTVRSGDTLSAIAKRFGVSTSAIIKANKIRNPSRIVAGQRLWIPGVRVAATPRPRPPVIRPTPTPQPQETDPPLIPTTRPSS